MTCSSSQCWGGGEGGPQGWLPSQGLVGELQDNEEILSQKSNQGRHLRLTFGFHIHKKQVSKEEGGFLWVGGVRDNPSMPMGEAWVRREVSVGQEAPRHELNSFRVAEQPMML